MKSTHVFRNKAHDSEPEDSLKRAAKLEPIKKSGKEKRAIYSRLDEDDDDEDDEEDADDANDDDIASEPFYEVACPNCGKTL